MNKALVAGFFLTAFSLACGGTSNLATPLPAPVISTDNFLPTPFQPVTSTASSVPSETATATLSATPFVTDTALPTVSLTPVPAWSWQGPGDVVVPILLYHHIEDTTSISPYYIAPAEFQQQMNLLHRWGYQTISVQLLVDAITQGTLLPPKPIILTFDDGFASISGTAVPILQQYGFTGTAYIVLNYIGLTGYMTAEQIQALAAAGWEIGSHSVSHVDLTVRSDRQRDEILDSRQKLQAKLGVTILSFAYPFGAYDSDSVHYAHEARYLAAVGLGNESLQSARNLFYLSRISITPDLTLEAFASRLPWQGDLSAITLPTPTP